MLNLIKNINIALAFCLELVMFFSFGSFGFSYGKTSITKWLFAIGLVLLGATLWGIFAAPKSEYRINSELRYLFEIYMFLTGAFFLYKNNHPNLALAWL